MIRILSSVQTLAIPVSVADTSVMFGPVGISQRRGEVLLGGTFARENVHPAPALLAHHEAAPVELALTLVHLAYSLGVVATPTTHDVTAVSAQ